MPDGTGVILEDLCPGVGLPAGVADWFANVARLELGDGLDIVFQPSPDPPAAGDNVLDVRVHDADGQPVTDADVSVTFFMAAMPSMNMPAMRTTAILPAVGGGIYRGTGAVIMAGRWNVTVTVTRDGQPLGVEQFSVVAR